MKKLLAILVAIVVLGTVIWAVTGTAAAHSYSTEATMTRQKEKGTYQVLVRVSRLVERNGSVTEELLYQPKITSSPGVSASTYQGSDYRKRESMRVDVAWPEAGKKGFAVCTVTVTLGDKIVSKSKSQVTVDEQ